MTTRSEASGRPQATPFRMAIEGHLGPMSIRWLEATRVARRDNLTQVDVRVADQADLYGRLHRVHALNLTLVSLQRLDEPDTDGSGPCAI